MKLTTIKIKPQRLERWKMIEGYGDYMVSSLGRVKSLGNNKNRKEKILKPSIRNDGYLLVGLYANGKAKTFLVHRLVANTFIPNPENKPEVNHIDENKANNNVKNLNWMTSKENINWGTRNERAGEAKKGKYTGENNPFFGKHHTEETKQKISEANKGENNPMYGVHRYGEESPFYGKHHSEETRKKISKARQGEKHPMYGKHHSEETRKKMRKPVIGINLKTNEIIELNSAKQGKEFGFSSGNITNCCKNKYGKQGNVYKGYKFYYKEDYEKLQQEQEISLDLLLIDNIKIKM